MASLTFEFAKMAQGANGEAPIDCHVVAWPRGRGLACSIFQGRDNIDPEAKPGRVRRTTRLFEIAVAKSGKE